MGRRLELNLSEAAVTKSTSTKRLRHAILFLLPLAIVLGVPGFVLWWGGELTSPETVVHRQIFDRRLVLDGPAYTNSALYIKVRVLTQRRPQLLALGNSRVMQFRREFFRPEVRFYNAGGTVARVTHFRGFLETLPQEALPEMLLIAMDTGYFNLRFDKVSHDKLNNAWLRNQLALHASATEVFWNNWRDVWGDIHAGKIGWTRLFSGSGLSTRIGLNALCNGAGYRNDGSYQYSSRDLDIADSHNSDYQFEKSLKCVATGSGRFVWGKTPSEPALNEVDALLGFCAEHHIQVIGFLPPYPHAVWAAMQGLGDRYGYVAKLEPELRSRFEARGFEFYNFNDFAALGAPDTEAIDGLHGNERVYLRIVIAMLERGSRLNAYASLPELRAMLAAPKAKFGLFPEEP
jgi:hypothetical protein